MTARLVVSLSGAALDHCAEFVAELDRRAVPLSLLLAPRARRAPVRWLRDRTARGDALVLHGYDHARCPSGVPRVGRRAEFATLPAHEARLRLIAANRELERLGLVTSLFAPPRWLASPGTLAALRRCGFAVCADLSAVHDLRTGAVHRGRVLGFGQGGFGQSGLGQGGFAEPWWCRMIVLNAARLARRGGLVRLTVDATDVSREVRLQAVLDAVDVALHHGAVPYTYGTLRHTAAPRQAAA